MARSTVKEADVANEPEKVRFPRLPEGWADGTARAATTPPTPPSEAAAQRSQVARWEKERRDITSAMLVLLVAAIAFFVLDYRSLVGPALGVVTGFTIRLLLLDRKITRLRDDG